VVDLRVAGGLSENLSGFLQGPRNQVAV